MTGITDITASGVITGGTVEATTDTAAGDNAAMGYTAAEGLILTGQGSSSDVTIKNDADATAISIATGTTATTFAGEVFLNGGAYTHVQMQTSGSDNGYLSADSSGNAYLGAATSLNFRTGSGANTSVGGTDALILNASQNATFAGDVIVDTGANAASITINSPSQTWSGGENLGELNWYTEDTSGAGPANVAAIKVTSTGSNTLPLAAMVFQTSAANATATTALTLDSGQDATFAGNLSNSASALWPYASSGIGTNGYTIAPSGITSITADVGAGSPLFYVNRNNAAGQYANFYYRGTSVGNIGGTASSTSYNTSSDYRLKENVVTDWDATTRLKQLKPSRFNFIVDADTTVDGFLAHEAQAVVPECVTGLKDAMKDEEYEVSAAVDATYDDDGNELTAAVEAVMATRSVPDYQGIDQSKLVPLLVKTIQELEARITALEA